VVINDDASSTALSVFLASDTWPATVTPWVTSGSDDLAAGAPIALSAGRFTTMLAAQSITTFVGN
jgi:glucuronoarabinoxylan endo-1,4-beta-xylanase